jgi:hypothetical protein
MPTAGYDRRECEANRSKIHERIHKEKDELMEKIEDAVGAMVPWKTLAYGGTAALTILIIVLGINYGLAWGNQTEIHKIQETQAEQKVDLRYIRQGMDRMVQQNDRIEDRIDKVERKLP